jgi:uncharacterized protein YpuA (DUF1002 family)
MNHDAEADYKQVQESLSKAEDALYQALEDQPTTGELFVGLAIDSISSSISNALNMVKTSIFVFLLVFICNI